MTQQKNDKKNLSIKVSNNSISIQQMIQYILKQINDINQSDIRIMQYSQIISIYNQLVNQNLQQAQQLNTRNQLNINKEKEKDNEGYSKIISHSEGNKDDKQVYREPLKQPSQQKQIHQNNRVKINGSYYFVPQCFKRESYNIANKRYSLICRPEPDSISQKKRLVSESLSPSMSQSVKRLTDKQIQQTYQNLKVINRSQIYLSTQKKQYKYPQIKQFIIYTKQQQLSQAQKKFIINQQQSISFNNNKNQLFLSESMVQQNSIYDVNNQFFNQYADKKYEKNIEQKNKIKQHQKLQNIQSIKQTINSVKAKNKTQHSVQTDNIKSQKIKTKSKITIVSQVQYIDDNNDNNNIIYNQKQLNIDNMDQLKTRNIEQNSKVNNIVHALINPKDMPDPSIIKWINNIKNLLIKFQYEYLNQFKSNWVVIQ